MEENKTNPEKEESVIFGRKVTGKKAVVVGSVVGIICGLLVVGILALLIMNI